MSGEGGNIICDDCAHGCRERCVYVREDEQPYFQAFRLDRRIAPGEPWSAWDYMMWNGRQWAAFAAWRGISREQATVHADEFRAWLFQRVGHPEAA